MLINRFYCPYQLLYIVCLFLIIFLHVCHFTMSNDSNFNESLILPLNHSTETLSIEEWETLSVVNENDNDDCFNENEIFNGNVRHNIIDLEVKTDRNVVAFLKQRYLDKQFYTWAGQTLLSIHPYEDFPPRKCDNKGLPSVDGIVSRAWFKLSRDVGKSNQTIVISGESGSGKTYSACLAMKSIAGLKDVAGCESILWQTWYSVPLLTAFGNAPNEHNNNSSRFGKLLQLQWNDGEIVGAFIKTFLLEKCRVSGPNTNEGNFHIFRQIFDSLDSETLSNLYLDPKVNYKIAPPSDNIIRSTYAETLKALKMLNITELNEIMIILATILNLGNVTFICKEDQIHIGRESQKFLINTSKLLKIEPESLIKLLVTKSFATKGRDSVYTSLCSNKEECYERRNCLMRFLYNNLFLWLIDRINEQIYAEGDYKLLGILDIYGFEVFENNTFEQLCINYANERLQQYYVNDYLLKQKEDLESEGFEIENIDTSSYSQRIDLLDGNISIFGILNEECTMKRFNTDVFVNIRLSDTFGGNKYFEKPSNNFSTIFIIKHFAGDVAYNTKTMLYKNRDKIPEEMISFLKDCKFPFLECILQTDDKLTNKTSLKKFKNSLDNLINTLEESDVHYIKCLKPNNFQLNAFVDELFLKNQLQSNGILEILKLQFQNYYIKYPLNDFLKSFSNNTFNCLQLIFKDSIHIGKKFIYLTEEAYYGFEILKFVERSSAARKVQRCWINYARRKKTILTIQQIENDQNIVEELIDLRKTSSELYITRDDSSTTLTPDQFASSCLKAEEYLRVHHVKTSYEGEPLSLCLEKVFNNLQTKKFKRVLFSGDGIVSYNRLAEIPVRLHLSKTCIPYSHLLPKSELPKGLTDIF